jgi:hypothetical protein
VNAPCQVFKLGVTERDYHLYCKTAIARMRSVPWETSAPFSLRHNRCNETRKPMFNHDQTLCLRAVRYRHILDMLVDDYRNNINCFGMPADNAL